MIRAVSVKLVPVTLVATGVRRLAAGGRPRYTSYPVTAAPPLEAGALQDSFTVPLAPVAASPCGADGTAAGCAAWPTPRWTGAQAGRVDRRHRVVVGGPVRRAGVGEALVATLVATAWRLSAGACPPVHVITGDRRAAVSGRHRPRQDHRPIAPDATRPVGAAGRSPAAWPTPRWTAADPGRVHRRHRVVIRRAVGTEVSVKLVAVTFAAIGVADSPPGVVPGTRRSR